MKTENEKEAARRRVLRLQRDFQRGRTHFWKGTKKVFLRYMSNVSVTVFCEEAGGSESENSDVSYDIGADFRLQERDLIRRRVDSSSK